MKPTDKNALEHLMTAVEAELPKLTETLSRLDRAAKAYRGRTNWVKDDDADTTVVHAGQSIMWATGEIRDGLKDLYMVHAEYEADLLLEAEDD